MRKLLMIVIFLNALDAVGKFLTTLLLASSDIKLFVKFGMALDAILWPLSIVIIGIAVLFLYKVEPKQDS